MFWASHLLLLLLAGPATDTIFYFAGTSNADRTISGGLIASGLIVLFSAAAVLVRVIIDTRRLHDRARSGLWLIIPWSLGLTFRWGTLDGSFSHSVVGFFFFIALAWYFIELGVFPGDEGENRFGPAPTGASVRRYIFSGFSWDKYAINSAIERIVADKLACDRARAAAAEQLGNTEGRQPPPTSVPSIAPNRPRSRV